MLFHTNVECGQRAAMLLSRVQQDWLVHSDPNWQPGPKSEKLLGRDKFQNYIKIVLVLKSLEPKKNYKQKTCKRKFCKLYVRGILNFWKSDYGVGAV